MPRKDNDVALADLLDQIIVIDTKSTTLAIGRLVRIADDCLVLEDADLHDREEGYSSKELYVINVRKFGVRPNREKVYIPRDTIIAVSALDDFIVD